MGKSQETFSKKEHEKKKAKKRKEKEEKKLERKSNNNKGKSFEDMIAYVDENGQLTSTPPDPNKKKVLKLEDIQLGAAKHDVFRQEEVQRKGTITFFNESKGYGFIKDELSKDSIFFHVNGLLAQVKEQDKVTFEVEQGQKGLNAVRINKA
ncbi:MAG: cold-shock protein [Bacteroidia bacterium]